MIITLKGLFFQAPKSEYEYGFEILDMLIGDFAWNELQKNPNYIKDICGHFIDEKYNNYHSICSMCDSRSFSPNDDNFSEYWSDYCKIKTDFLSKDEKYKIFIHWLNEMEKELKKKYY